MIQSFAFWGYVSSAIFVLAYTILRLSQKKKLAPLAFVEIPIACIAASTAAEIFWHCIQAHLHGGSIVLQGRDLDVAIAGCSALIVIAALAVIREFK